MQQAGNPAANLRQLVAADVDYNSVEIEDDERKTILLKTGKGDRVLTLQEKKDLAIECLGLYSDVLKDIKAIDPTDQTNLLAKTDAIIGKRGVWRSKTQIKDSNNNDLADKILDITRIFESIEVTLEERANNSLSTRTRRLSRVEDESPTRLLYKDLLDLRDKIDVKVRTAMANSTNDSILKGQKLPLYLSSRRFHPSLVPVEESLQTCVFCNHQSINIVPEDEGYVQRNQTKLDQYDAKMGIWEKYKKEKDAAAAAERNPPPFPTNPYANPPTEMRRAPTKVKASELEGARLFCNCLNSHCAHRDSDVDNSCPCKCRKKNGEGDTRNPTELANDPSLKRYEWNGSTSSRCQCPMCRCVCNKLYNRADISKIMLRLRQKQLQGSNSVSQPNRQQVLGNFFSKAIAAGATEAQTLSTARRDAGGKPEDDEVMQNRFIDATAQHIVQNGAAALGLEGAALLQSQFGRSTGIRLPEGQTFDTHMVTSNNSAHLRNNRITGAATSDTIPPGMLDNLHPSFQNPSEQFVQAATNPTSLAHAITSILPSLSATAPSSSHQQSSVAAAGAGSSAAAATGTLSAQQLRGMSEEQQLQLAMKQSQQPLPMAGMDKQRQIALNTSAAETCRGNGGSGQWNVSCSGGGKPSSLPPVIELLDDSQSPSSFDPTSHRIRGKRRELNLFEPLFAPGRGLGQKPQGSDGKAKIWNRIRGANGREKRMDLDKSDLTSDQKKARKCAKKTGRSMEKRGDGKQVIDELLATERVPSSQASAYERGELRMRLVRSSAVNGV